MSTVPLAAGVDDADLERRLAARLVAVGAPDDPAAVARLRGWLALHRKWSRVANLTGTRDPSELVDLHLTDCAAIVPLLPPGRLLDVGSGAGLPGLVIAALQPDRPVVLLDAASKRTRFLEQATLELGLDAVTVVTARCEAWRPSEDAPLAGVVARALAPLERLVAWTRHLLVPGVPLLAMKGPAWRDEARALPAGFHVAAATPCDLPGTARAHVLVRIEQTDASSVATNAEA
ncbi:MAG: 16S rRNA (guanine(527)-N(7))-methyltransferase RsmG [Pseudomonadales bacterium]|nr:16S rRNA (guanine(527)-N(7))-methyltransferase RsmG [Pseudomonadales bacterium]